MIIKSKGLTLIELVTVIAIVGIITAVAWPLYDSHVRKVTRTDAVRALHIAANDMEECAAAAGGDFTNCQFTSREIVGNQTPNGRYTLAIVFANGGGYLISATRNGGDDPQCQAGPNNNYQLIINNLGQQGIRLGADPIITNTQQVRTCWNK